MGNLRSQGKGRKAILVFVLAAMLGACRSVPLNRHASGLNTTPTRPSLLLRIPVRQAIGVTDLPVEVRYLRPDPRARLLIVAWDSAEGESGSHAETLSGGSELVLHRWTITVTPGDYVFSATSVDGLGRVLETFSETVIIHGSPL